MAMYSQEASIWPCTARRLPYGPVLPQIELYGPVLPQIELYGPVSRSCKALDGPVLEADGPGSMLLGTVWSRTLYMTLL